MPSAREIIVRNQLLRLNAPESGLSLLAADNEFYRKKLEGVSLPLSTLDQLRQIRFTTKPELVTDQSERPPYGTALTYPPEKYTRFHATSGTSGRPLRVLDTDESWAWFTRCWQEVYRAFGVGPGDRVFLAFGFGPFIGFWAGFEAAHQVGARAIPGGAMSSLQRITAILELEATVLVSTPTYALRLAEVARENGIELARSAVRMTVHAGEPGASIPQTRKQIEQAWSAQCRDHAGLSEAGAWGYECPKGEGLHLLESEFVAEVLEPGGEKPVAEGETGELVLTNLGRWANPALRYRTGDLVRVGASRPHCSCGSPFITFPGAVLGRADDMIQVRGVNVYPAAVETIVREESAVAEFQVEVFERRQMWEMRTQIEVVPEANAEAVRMRIARELESRLGLRTEVVVAAPGTLPRFELKARRFHIRRGSPPPEQTK